MRGILPEGAFLTDLLLLPGLLLDDAYYAAQVDGLRGVADCTIVSYGSADSIEEMARVALAAAPPRFYVAGHSMGGRVAAQIWRLAPERVAGLALLNTGYRPLVKGEQERRYALLQVAREKGTMALAGQWLPGLVPAERLHDASLMEPMYEMIGRKTPEIFEAQIRALLNRVDSEAVLRSVSVKSLVLAGRFDMTAPLAGHEEMAGMIAGANLVVLDCAHMAAMERPAETTAALRAWLVA